MNFRLAKVCESLRWVAPCACGFGGGRVTGPSWIGNLRQLGYTFPRKTEVNSVWKPPKAPHRSPLKGGGCIYYGTKPSAISKNWRENGALFLKNDFCLKSLRVLNLKLSPARRGEGIGAFWKIHSYFFFDEVSEYVLYLVKVDSWSKIISQILKKTQPWENLKKPANIKHRRRPAPAAKPKFRIINTPFSLQSPPDLKKRPLAPNGLVRVWKTLRNWWFFVSEYIGFRVPIRFDTTPNFQIPSDASRTLHFWSPLFFPYATHATHSPGTLLSVHVCVGAEVDFFPCDVS